MKLWHFWRDKINANALDLHIVKCTFISSYSAQKPFFGSFCFFCMHLRTCLHHMWISKQQWNNTVEVLASGAVCGAVWQCAIVETISQLFSLACDWPKRLMWEPHSPPSLPSPCYPTPWAHSAWGWVLSQQEGKVSAWLWHQNKWDKKKQKEVNAEQWKLFTWTCWGL